MITKSKEIKPSDAVALVAWTLPAWFVGWASDQDAFCMIAAVLAIVATGWWGWKLINNPLALVHLLSLGSIVLVALLNLGYFIAYCAATWGLNTELKMQYGGIPISGSTYAVAIIYGTLFALILAFCGSLNIIVNNERLLAEKISRVKDISANGILILMISALVFDLVVLKLNIFGFRNVNVDGYSSGKLPWFLPFLKILIAIQIPINMLALQKSFSGGRVKWGLVFLAINTTLIVAYFHFLQGRISFLLCLILYFLFWCFFRMKRPRMIYLLGLVASLAVALPPALILNNFMRNYEARFNVVDAGGGLSLAVKAWETLNERSSVQANAERETMANLSARPLVARPLAICIQQPYSSKTFLMGNVLLTSFAWIVPQIIFPGKTKFGNPEVLMYIYFNIPYDGDAPSSAYLYSYLDFGWIGLLIYPFLLVAAWVLSLKLMLNLKEPLFVLAIMMIWLPLFVFSIGEGSMITWMVGVRNTIMFWMVFTLIRILFPGLRLFCK